MTGGTTTTPSTVPMPLRRWHWAQAVQIQALPFGPQGLVGVTGQGEQQQAEGEAVAHQGRGGSIGRSSRRMSSAWARPSRRTQG